MWNRFKIWFVKNTIYHNRCGWLIVFDDVGVSTANTVRNTALNIAKKAFAPSPVNTFRLRHWLGSRVGNGIPFKRNSSRTITSTKTCYGVVSTWRYRFEWYTIRRILGRWRSTRFRQSGLRREIRTIVGGRRNRYIRPTRNTRNGSPDPTEIRLVTFKFTRRRLYRVSDGIERTTSTTDASPIFFGQKLFFVKLKHTDVYEITRRFSTQWTTE